MRSRKRQLKPRDAGLKAVHDALGSFQAIGDLVGVTPQAIDQWQNGIPIKYVKRISEATGIPKYVLRSDIFDKENGEVAA